MTKRFLLLALLIPFFFGSVQAQFNQRNFSVQAGYQFKLLSPKAFNFILEDIFNTRSPLPVDPFTPVRWTPGLAVGAGFHRGKISLSAHFDQFGASSSAIADDSLGTELQWDAKLMGWNAGVSFVSELVPFADNGGVHVGGALQMTKIQTGLATAPTTQALPEYEITNNLNRMSFNIMLPIRYGPIPQFQFSVEPYYQVFFSPVGLRNFSNALNGAVRTEEFSGGVISEMDHFGVTAKVIVFLIPRG